MNKERRLKLSKIAEKLDELQKEIEGILSDEQESFDNLPENLQSSVIGERMENAIGTLEDAVSNIDDCIQNIEESCSTN